MSNSRADILVDEIIALLSATDRSATYHNDDVMQVFNKEFRESLTGRHVYVMTNSQDQPSAASRAKTNAVYVFWIVGVERCTAVGVPSVTWQRQRKKWMESIFDMLNDVGLYANIDPRPYPESVQWQDIMDKGMILQGLFWSDIILTLQRIE